MLYSSCRSQLGQSLYSCTSLVDGWNRTWYQVTQDAALVALPRPGRTTDAWPNDVDGRDCAGVRIGVFLSSGFPVQGDTDDMQWPVVCTQEAG